MKLTTSSLFRLTAVAAVMIAMVNWWPRSTSPGRDGSIAWYHGTMWNRHYYKVTGTDVSGCNFAATVKRLPDYCPMEGTYPDGTKREITKVLIRGHQDGCNIDRKDVIDGVYYAPDGTEVGRVVNGSGTIKYCRPDGTSEAEYTLESGQVTRDKFWAKNGVLQTEHAFANGLLNGDCIDYHADGSVRSRSHYVDGQCVKAHWYDQKGNVIRSIDNTSPSRPKMP